MLVLVLGLVLGAQEQPQEEQGLCLSLLDWRSYGSALVRGRLVARAVFTGEVRGYLGMLFVCEGVFCGVLCCLSLRGSLGLLFEYEASVVELSLLVGERKEL